MASQVERRAGFDLEAFTRPLFVDLHFGWEVTHVDSRSWGRPENALKPPALQTLDIHYMEHLNNQIARKSTVWFSLQVLDIHDVEAADRLLGRCSTVEVLLEPGHPGFRRRDG